MYRGFKRRFRIGPAMAFFIVFLMSISAFAGAIEIETIDKETEQTTTSNSGRDIPGELDSDVDYGIDLSLSGSTTENSLDNAMPDNFEPNNEGMLTGEVPNEGQEFAGEAGSGSDIHDFQELREDENGMGTLQDTLHQITGDFISTNNNALKASAQAIESDKKPYQNNLYKSVSDYLNRESRDNEYLSFAEELRYQGYTPENEVISERTETTKVFANGDGTYTAVINEAPLHYRDELGRYQDIDLNIQPSNNGKHGYESTKNILNTYFPEDYPEDEGISVDIDGNSAFSWKPDKMTYVDKYLLSHDIGDATTSHGIVDHNSIKYENTFPSTTEEFIVLTGELKHNFILEQFPQNALSGIYMSYVGKAELGSGLHIYVDGMPITASMETRNEIELRSETGIPIYTLPPPLAFEYDDMSEMVEGSYSIIVDGKDVFIAINTPVSWLTDPARDYPVVIDPNLYVTLDMGAGGYVYRYFYKHYSSGSTTESYTYVKSSEHRIGFSATKTTTYERTYSYRTWFKWDTSAIDDSYKIKQVDFHGKQWYNTYNGFGVNLRLSPLKPDEYSSSSGQAKLKELWSSLGNGAMYNSSIMFPRATSYTDIDIYALGGSACQDLKDNLTNNVFYLAMQKSLESFISVGYGYFRLYYPYQAQIYVTYDPCPIAPTLVTGGPYYLPEGSIAITLDASKSFVCGSTALYSWDLGGDGSYDVASTSPTMVWGKRFPDNIVYNLTLQVKDITYGYIETAKTTLTVYNVDPEIITPAAPINGEEGSTVTFPRVEFTDPGADTWTYYYDFDGDNEIDRSGSTVEIGGRHYVPSVSWYFCDNEVSVNLTVEDDDGGFSDSVEQEYLDVDYDGELTWYQRTADPARDYYYRYMTVYSSTYMYVRYRSDISSYDYDYRGLTKFDTSRLPADFQPNRVTLRTYVYRVNGPGKVGVNSLTDDPYTSASETVFTDADDINILKDEDYFQIDSSDESTYVYMNLDPDDFIEKLKLHSNWYGIAFDRYDKQDSRIYLYFRGGTYTTLTVSNGTHTYVLYCYTGTYSNTNGMHGYIYKRCWPARDEMWRTDTSSYIYIEEYKPDITATQERRGFIRFPAPAAHVSKIIGADIQVRVYIYGTPNDIKVGITDIGSDPEATKDRELWQDMSTVNIYDGTEWEPDLDYYTYTVPLKDSDIVEKLKSGNEWYGIGIKKNAGTSRYIRLYSDDYPSTSYRPRLTVDHRVPYTLMVNIKNVDPVLDMRNVLVSPTVVMEGDEVSVTGVKYTDAGNCDTHKFRIVVPGGPGKEPAIVKDWTNAAGGKLDFKFKAPDDDPEDADPDISKDKITLQIEIIDDDYIPDLHYNKVLLELNHYEYYMYSWYKDWGVYQNLMPWNEDTVTWNNYPRANSKSTPEDTVKAHGLHYYFSPYDYHFDVWDVTTLAKEWLDGTTDNYGLRVQPTTPGSDPNRMYSSDISSTSQRPILRFIPKEPEQPEVVLQPDSTTGKDARLRDYPYYNYNYGRDSYLTYTYDSSTSSNRYETNGLIEFDLRNVPPETDRTGFNSAPFTLTINNVDPKVSLEDVEISLLDGRIVDSVYEGQEFMVSGIKIYDPAAGYESEVFEYRVDFGDGIFSPWSSTNVIVPSNDIVVPNDHDTTQGTGNNVIPFRPSFGRLRYQQWYSASELGGASIRINKISFRPDSILVDWQWGTTYNGLKVYLSHTKASTLSSTFADNFGTERKLVYSGTLKWNHEAGYEGWMDIPLQNHFDYDGNSNLVLEISYDSGSESGYSPAVMDADYTSTMHRLYGYSSSSTTGSRQTGFGLVTKFSSPSDLEPFGVIPTFNYAYPDDHPETKTASDVIAIKIQVKDDDLGSGLGILPITVKNVEPELKGGEVLVNGKLLPPNILIVVDSYSNYNYVDWVETLKDCGQRSLVTTPGGLTLSEMNKYDVVFWLAGGYYVRWALSSAAERNLITSYINGGGKFILQGTDWYNYESWARPFYTMFGIDTYIISYYMSSESYLIRGTGGHFDYDEYELARGHTEIRGRYNYFSMVRPLDGEMDFWYTNYLGSARYVMAHRDDPKTGSIAMMMGFDLNHIDSRVDQVELMTDILDYFGIKSGISIEIDEGDCIEIQNVDIVDPAEGEETEFFHFEIDWGDGVIGPLANVTGTGGVNKIPTHTGPGIVVPNDHEDVPGTSQNTIPWGPNFGTRRYQQLYDASQLGGLEREIESIGFRISGTFSITYNNLQMYLSQTSSSSLSSYFANNYGSQRTLVLSSSSYTYSKTTFTNDFEMIPLEKSFKYDGYSNLVLEVVYTSGTMVNIFFDADPDPSLYRLWASSPTAVSGSYSSGYGLVTKFGFKKIEVPEDKLPWESYMHTYRDNPCSGDTYYGTIHVYDDDQGHGTMPMMIKVNNVRPEIDPKYVLPTFSATESGMNNLLLPSVPFADPGTQSTECSEVWTYWWDLDFDGKVHNSPDEVGMVPSGLVTEKDNRSFGRTPQLDVCVNDDYIIRPIALYIFDDDMAHDLSSRPTQVTSTVTVKNAAPEVTLEAYVPMEVRVRMSGTKENDLRVQIRQTDPVNTADVLVDEMTIERMPGEPKENPLNDGSPSAPLFVKIDPVRKIEVVVTFDATPDPNDMNAQSGPNGADPVYVFLDFPMEDDYNPRDDDQSTQGHHWTGEYKFNVNQDTPVATETSDVTTLISGKRGFIVGTSTDDSSDDAQFYWKVLAGNVPIPYTSITYYNDGSEPVVNGAFSDKYPTPWTGSAPITYMDMHEFVYTGGFSLELYTVDDDGGRSETVTLSLS